MGLQGWVCLKHLGKNHSVPERYLDNLLSVLRPSLGLARADRRTSKRPGIMRPIVVHVVEYARHLCCGCDVGSEELYEFV